MAELALAIAPILLSACQGFVVLKKKIHVFRHYKKEVKWLHRKVEVQAKCYKGEMHHLVINALEDKHKAQSMISDDNHAYWKDPDLESTFQQYMGHLFVEFLSAAQDVHQALVNIEAKLAIFAPPDVKSPLFKATRDKFRLAFKKDQYQDDIDTLKESISELKRVRKLAATFAKKPTNKGKQIDLGGGKSHLTTTDPTVYHNTVRQYRYIRHLSTSFQAFLQEQWTCCSPSHSQHKGTLFLSCASERRPSVVWSLESIGIRGLTTMLSNRFLFNVVSQPSGLLTPDSETKSFRDSERLPKRKRVSPQPPDRLPSRQELVPANNSLPGLCEQLEAVSVGPRSHQHPLIRPDAQRQEIYRFEPQQVHPVILSSGKTSKAANSSNILTTMSAWDPHKTKSRPLSRLLDSPPQYVMLDRERIRLAAGLVRATLMAHSTPGWPGQRHGDHHGLPTNCLLDQISFLSQWSAETSAGVDIDSLLHTLNIPVAVGDPTHPSKTIASSHSDTDMTDAGDINTTMQTHNKTSDHSSNRESTEEDLKDTYGIRNLVLYRLGVALLSIGLWRSIPWKEFASVRRKARALDWGGAEYKCAVHKLINGDFGLGVGDLDLEDEDLQIEIVKTIVGPLESTVGSISRSNQGGGGGVLSSENLKGLQAHESGGRGGGGVMWLTDSDRWVGPVQELQPPPPPPYPRPGPSSTLIGSPGGMDGGDGEFDTIGSAQSSSGFMY